MAPHWQNIFHACHVDIPRPLSNITQEYIYDKPLKIHMDGRVLRIEIGNMLAARTGLETATEHRNNVLNLASRLLVAYNWKMPWNLAAEMLKEKYPWRAHQKAHYEMVIRGCQFELIDVTPLTSNDSKIWVRIGDLEFELPHDTVNILRRFFMVYDIVTHELHSLTYSNTPLHYVWTQFILRMSVPFSSSDTQ